MQIRAEIPYSWHAVRRAAAPTTASYPAQGVGAALGTASFAEKADILAVNTYIHKYICTPMIYKTSSIFRGM